MDIPNSFPHNQRTIPTANKYARLENFDLIKTLNSGVSSVVKLGIDIIDQSEYVIKIVKKEFQDKYLNDSEKIKRFMDKAYEEEHNNIIKRLNILPKAKYIKKNGKIKEVFAIILEYAHGGDLFECIKVTGNLKEEIARTYFQQLIDTIDYLHSKGVAHRDLKPDNLLLASDFKMKISDFSLSSFIIQELNGVQKLENHLCLAHYSAPEILEGNISNPFALDIFSCGIILFIMVVGTPPFEKANPQCPRYKMIMKHQFDSFWKTVERSVKLTTDFKNLVSSMICYDPFERVSISEVKAHSWYSGTIYSADQLREEYKAKEADFIAYRESKQQQIAYDKEEMKKHKIMLDQSSAFSPIGKLAFHSYHNVSVQKYRSFMETVEDKIKSENSKLSKDEKRVSREHVYTSFRGLNELVYDVEPEIVFKIAMAFVQSKFNTYKIHDSKLKIKGRVISSSGSFSGEISLEVTKLDENLSCISFSRLSGSLNYYYKFIEEEAKKMIDDILIKISD